MERLQKFLANAGIASRRKCEEIIQQGRVDVNGKTVTTLGTVVDPLKDNVRVDGRVITLKRNLVYILINKPRGYVTTLADPEGRRKVSDLLKGVSERVYPVGRLDYDTEGLLLMTNDGELAFRLTHPRFHIPKTYVALVKGTPSPDKLTKLEKGIFLEDGLTAPAKLKALGREELNTRLQITIHEGRNRQVRRMFEAVGHPVIFLKRVSLGQLQLNDLKPGAFRYLTPQEVSVLKKAAKMQ